MNHVPIHRRTIDYQAFEEGDSIRVEARLQDTRPWAAGTSAVEQVHDMELHVTVSKGTMTITEASARMNRFPHVECPQITPAFDGLIGLNIARGYTRAVQEKFGRQFGCTHLETLARALGPVVIQSVTSCLAARVERGEIEDLMSGQTPSDPWALNTCHIWAEDGIAVSKIKLGWRPGRGTYPAPSVDDIATGNA